LAHIFLPFSFSFQILADIKDLRYQIQAELSFKDGLRDIIRKTRDDLEKANAQASLKDTERNIDELEEQLDKLEIAFKKAYLMDGVELEEEEEEDEENWEYLFEPMSPIKVSGLHTLICPLKPPSSHSFLSSLIRSFDALPV